MPIEKSRSPHDIPHTTFWHKGISYNQLYGYSDGDGLSCGIITIEGHPGIAIYNPYGIVCVVLQGVFDYIDSEAPEVHHEFQEGETFHIKKGSTFTWGAKTNGKAFYTAPKPIDIEFPESLKKPVFEF